MSGDGLFEGLTKRVKEKGKESFTESVRQVVILNGIEVAMLDRLKGLVFERRQKLGLITADDNELVKGSKSVKKFSSRVNAGMIGLRRCGEAVLIDRKKYRFFL